MNRPPTSSGSPDAGLLPSLLDGLAARIAVTDVDRLWIFPPHRIGHAESSVFVISAFDSGEHRRRVLTARFTARRDASGTIAVQDHLAEHGIAPADRIGRLIDGVLRRLSDDLAATPPLAAHIRGDPDRWADLRSTLAASSPSP